MKIKKANSHKQEQPAGLRRRANRGVALVITLLLLALLMALAVAMVVASSTDLLIGGYYKSHRSGFYGADSGLSIVRQQVANQLAAQAPANFPPGTPPLPANAAAVVQAAVLAQYGAFTTLNAGAAANSWPESFRLNNLALGLVAAPAQPVVTACSGGAVVNPLCPGGGQPTGYQYTYNYTISSFGRSNVGDITQLDETGSIVLNATVTAANPMTMSFAAWGFFVDNQTVCSGSYLVPGTISGPVHSNGGWTFGTTGAYIFTDALSQSNNNFGFQFSGRCNQSPTPPSSYNGKTISPTFQAGYNTGVPLVPLPSNDFSQKRAVLDGLGLNTNAPTGAEMNAVLKNITGASYPVAGANGVWMPYTTDPVTGVSSVVGGGIYVQGDAAVTLSTVGASGQRFTITQGGVTTTITTDPAANTTTIAQAGQPTKVVQGVPTDLTKVPPIDSTMLYVQGNITALKGPAQGQAAIQDGSGVTITASSNVTITGDLLYRTQPVTKVANDPCCPGTPPGTPIPGADNGQVLGVFTATGDIRLNNQQANGMLEIDASLATIGQGTTGGIINVGAQINTLNIVGGRIQNNIKNINSTTRNVYFDRRFSSGFAPPWFPSTTITPPGVASATFTTNMQRQRWTNMSTQ